MIVGNGMIANAMNNIEDDSYIFFCSGVAKSNEIDVFEFDKEKELLKSFYQTDKCLIYFSSYFVNFNSYLEIAYYKHKYEIESIIQLNFKNFKIFRLPQVVGFSHNKSTLANFIYYSILQDTTIKVLTGAVRNLIDIDDVVKVVGYVNKNNLFNNSILNIVGTKNYNIIDVISCMEDILHKKALIEYQDNNEQNLDILISYEMEALYKTLNIHFDDVYLKKLFFKYYNQGNKK